jgi:hypothetical protein
MSQEATHSIISKEAFELQLRKLVEGVRELNTWQAYWDIDMQKMLEACQLKTVKPTDLGPAWAKVDMSQARALTTIDVVPGDEFWALGYTSEFRRVMQYHVKYMMSPDDGSMYHYWQHMWARFARSTLPSLLPRKQRGPLSLPHLISENFTCVSVCHDENDPLRFELPILGTKDSCALTLSPAPRDASLVSMQMVLVHRMPWRVWTPRQLGPNRKAVLCEDMHVCVVWYAEPASGKQLRQELTAVAAAASADPRQSLCLMQCTNIVGQVPPMEDVPCCVFGHDMGLTFRFYLEGIDVSNPFICKCVFEYLRTRDTRAYGIIRNWRKIVNTDNPWNLPADVFDEILRMVPPPPSNAKARLSQFRSGIEA